MFDWFRKWFWRSANDKSDAFQRGIDWGLFWVALVGILLVAIKHLAGF